MSDDAVGVLIPLGTFIVGLLAGWIARYRAVGLRAEILKAREDVVQSKETAVAALRAELSAAHKSKELAVAQARDEWSVVVSPWKRLDDGLLRSSLATGYQCQLSYRGMPIGQPSVVIVREEKKVNKEQIEQLLKVAEVAANAYVEAVRERGARAELNY